MTFLHIRADVSLSLFIYIHSSISQMRDIYIVALSLSETSCYGDDDDYHRRKALPIK